MSLSLPPSPLSSRRSSSPSLPASAAFSTSPCSSPASPSSLFASMGCPLHSPSSRHQCDGAPNLVDHLINEHKAKHYDVFFNKEGVAEIQFETVVPLNESIVRKTAVLLSLPTGEILCWCVETKRRGDGELQASASIQIVETRMTGASSSAAATRRGLLGEEDDEEDFSSPQRSQSEALNSSNKRRASLAVNIFPTTAASFSPKKIVVDSPKDNDDDTKSAESTPEYIEMLYDATIIAGNEDNTLQWSGVLSSSHLSCHHEHLIAHGVGLIALYPTNKQVFFKLPKIKADGHEEMTLHFPVQLRLEAIAYQNSKSHHIITALFLSLPLLLINEKRLIDLLFFL